MININKINKYIDDIEYIKLNIEENTSNIIKNVNISRSIINRIKSNTHWSNEMTMSEIKIIGQEFSKTKIN